MLRRIAATFRPFGVAFGLFIVLNLALALQRAELSVTRIWLDADLPEPFLSLFAGMLGLALFVPHEAAGVPWVRWLTAGVFAGFGGLAVFGTVAFYLGLHAGRIATDLPVPLAALVAVVLSAEFGRVFRWERRPSSLPAPARVFLSGVAVAAALLVIALVHVVTYGHRDFRRPADAAVVFGAKVYPDGRLSDALRGRLDTGIELYRQGLVRWLVLTGALDPNGRSEPMAMRDYAVRQGIPASRLLLDEGGTNTRASAVNARRIAAERGFSSVLAVSQYFHCARVKMTFEREGVACATVPTCSSARASRGEEPRLRREGFFLLREAVAFPFYLIYYR